MKKIFAIIVLGLLTGVALADPAEDTGLSSSGNNELERQTTQPNDDDC